MAAQVRTDELRELLERYPDLATGELRRLRRLYREASATEVMAIMASPELAPKARRLVPPHDFTWDRMLAVLAFAAALFVALYLLVLET